jgi:hypothetical protein
MFMTVILTAKMPRTETSYIYANGLQAQLMIEWE